MYLSRKLTKAEVNYSNIKKGVLVLVWSTERAWQFLLGQKFLLKSDHQPWNLFLTPERSYQRLHLLKFCDKQ